MWLLGDTKIFTLPVSIKDPKVRSLIDLYSTQCFDTIIPQLQTAKKVDKISVFFNTGGLIDDELRSIKLKTNTGTVVTCLDIKEKQRPHYIIYHIPQPP